MAEGLSPDWQPSRIENEEMYGDNSVDSEGVVQISVPQENESERIHTFINAETLILEGLVPENSSPQNVVSEEEFLDDHYVFLKHEADEDQEPPKTESDAEIKFLDDEYVNIDHSEDGPKADLKEGDNFAIHVYGSDDRLETFYISKNEHLKERLLAYCELKGLNSNTPVKFYFGDKMLVGEEFGENLDLYPDAVIEATWRTQQ